MIFKFNRENIEIERVKTKRGELYKKLCNFKIEYRMNSTVNLIYVLIIAFTNTTVYFVYWSQK